MHKKGVVVCNDAQGRSIIFLVMYKKGKMYSEMEEVDTVKEGSK